MVQLRLLGPIELSTATHVVDLGPRKQQAVLAALLVDAGSPVPIEKIIDRVWGDAPPMTARGAVHSYITRLRRALSEANAVDRDTLAVEYRPAGYVLQAHRDQVDLHRFRRLLDHARATRGDDLRRAELLREALGLWRGQPLTGLTGAWAESVRREATQLRLGGVLDLAPIELAAGGGNAMIEQLRVLLDEHPLVEPLIATLIHALVAAGRNAEALELYAETRRRLADELGADPSPELRQAYHAALNGDRPPSPVERSPKPRHGPALLPADVPGFTGRAAALARLDDMAAAPDWEHTAVVSGVPGVGKSALAVHWAHRVRDRFPDGQLFADLRGFDATRSAVTSAQVVRGFLAALKVSAQQTPASLDAQIDLYRTLMADKRMLVVLDNARSAEQVRPLLPGSPGCFVLVTSRNQLSGLIAGYGAQPLALDVFTDAESTDLLARRIGHRRVTEDTQAAERIIASCARLPLALVITAARAVTRPTFPLRVLADELQQAGTSLDAFHSDDPATDVRSIFDCSYQALGADAADLFRWLGAHPRPDVGLPAAASVAAVPPGRARHLLTELTSVHLLTEHSPDRYAFHDLLNAYAIELHQRAESSAERHEVLGRVLDHYLHTAYRAALLMHPARDPITIPDARPGVTAETFADHDQALAWFTAERSVLLACVELADGSFDTHAWQLAWSMSTFLDRTGAWHDALSVHEQALAAAGRLEDHRALAYSRLGLALAHTRLGDTDAAATEYRHALTHYEQLEDLTGQAHIHSNLARVFEQQGHHAEALSSAEHALRLYRAAGHQLWEARAISAVGWYHIAVGNHRQALDHCRQALDQLRKAGDRDGESATWDSLGHAHHHQREYDQAETCYRRALAMHQQDGDRYNEALVLTHLGDNDKAAGQTSAARSHWRRALTILTDLRHPTADDVRSRLQAPGTSS
ncbi:SARP family transcriptional regulator [Acrocarpospora pleiomorpha]|uniref:SARP family transcriptional regulator n=1 Tax=Acrocarpospora pleiomorpha TaxID=90975 RepID=A0A5M3XSS4_9ACTN|nr:BTAD domain-containing putative transcriptional regulator [Acrocarpospora pleiomorpha]GES24344.1 SARP family transcriptional regulator [Acrocarpospora pleiomorpha]